MLADSTLKKEAARAGVDATELIELNKHLLKGLQLSSILLKGTRLLLSAGAPKPPPRQLFNRVVSIDGEEVHAYWYVLTYLPDLQWCHVAPLRQNGVFGAGEAPDESLGRPRWMLLPEEEGGEMDVGAARCRIMTALEIKKTKENADEEEWDIVGPEQP